MDIAAWSSVGATCLAALSAGFAGWQIRISRRQATTLFEDALAAEYRALLRELPVQALLADGMPDEQIVEHLGVFYRYFDLCNEQAFLAGEQRVSPATWEQWRDGIGSNMLRQAFSDAWHLHVRNQACIRLPSGKKDLDFKELRSLLTALGLDKPLDGGEA